MIDEAADVDANADSIPPGVRARIRRSLDDGHVVALAPSPSELAGFSYSDFWQVAPDGTTLGIGFRGWGQESGERIGIRGGDSIASASARNQAIQICQRFGVAATAMNVHLIQLELHASRGLRPPRPPADATARYRCPVTPGYPKVPSERMA